MHAEQSQFAFHDLKFGSLVETLWAQYSAINDSIAVFPDDGACKRYSKILKDRPYITFRKVRDGAKRIVSTDSKIEQKTYVIIDDLVRSGGTMNEVAKYLMVNGATSVDALFAHAPFEATAAKNLDIFKEVWTTNTCINLVPNNWVKLDVYLCVLDMYERRCLSFDGSIRRQNPKILHDLNP